MADDITFGNPSPEGNRQILKGGEAIGQLTRPKFAPKSTPGWFLTLDGVTWDNAPGARYTADAGGGAASTYVRSLGEAKTRINTHYEDKANAKRTS